MDETSTVKNSPGWRQRLRGGDAVLAKVIVLGDLLLCGKLLMMAVSSMLDSNAPERTVQATTELVRELYFGWFVAGLLLFGLLRMGRSSVAHLLCMLAPPGLLVFGYVTNGG